MARITAAQAGGQNRVAFLDTISFSEGTNIAGSDDGYNVVVTGIDGKTELFKSYDDHPFAGGRKSKVINSNGLTSSASGRYQQMLRDWPHYKAKLRLADFGPLSQDLVALQHIRECRALPDIDAGNFAEAVDKCKNIWASFPGAGYGQREHALAPLLAFYRAAGGFAVKAA